MPVRNETAEDRGAIATIIARTYLGEGASTIEQTGSLRDLDCYDTDLSFVFEDDKSIKAFSLYTPVKVDGNAGAVVLAPLAVDPKSTDFDVVAFLEETFAKVKAKGYRYIFVLANLDDLAPLGFVFADTLGFSLEDNPPVSLLVKDLGEGNTLNGEVDLPKVLLV